MIENVQSKIEKFQSRTIFFHLAVGLFSILIMFWRRPDAFLNPQFWAEDGAVWYSQAYQFGLSSLFMPELGYFQLDTRLVANFSQLFPLASAPLIFNIFAISAKLVVVQFFISSRLSKTIPSLPVRLLLVVLYLALPNAYEVDANLTNMHWHLGILAFLIVIAEPDLKKSWKFFDVIFIGLTVLSSPFGFFLFPIGLLQWWKTRNIWTLCLTGIILGGCLVQGLSLVMNPRISDAVLGAGFILFTKIMSHIFLGAIIGDTGYSFVLNFNIWRPAVTILITFAGLAFFLYALLKAQWELKLFILYAALSLTASLLSPAIDPGQRQWEVMVHPGACTRYWLAPGLCFLTILVFFAVSKNFLYMRIAPIILLTASLIGICGDWKLNRLPDYQFSEYAKKFEASAVGEEIIIPINPNTKMKLIKK